MSISSYFLLANAAYLAIVSLLFALEASMPVAGFYARVLTSWVALLICAIYGTLASIVLRIAGKSGLSQWTTARSFKWTMHLATGVRFVLQDEEYLETRPAVFLGNHQTELDVLMLGTIFPPYCSVTAKKSLKYMPFLGWFMALSKTVFIDRGNRQKSGMALESAANQMRSERQSVFMFPEGTRSYASTPDLLPFKKGAFHLAIQAQVPIVPIVVANYSNVLHVQSKVFRSGDIPVKILKPIPTKGLTSADVDSLTQTTRDLMMKELTTLSEISRSQGTAMTEKQAIAMDGRSAKATGVDAGDTKVRPGF